MVVWWWSLSYLLDDGVVVGTLLLDGDVVVGTLLLCLMVVWVPMEVVLPCAVGELPTLAGKGSISVRAQESHNEE